MAEHSSRRSPFQYVLCAATSPAVKHQDETLTYLNQGKIAPCLSLSPLGCCPRHLHVLPSLHFKHQQQHLLWSNTCYCNCDNFFLSFLLIGSNSCQVTLLVICGDWDHLQLIGTNHEMFYSITVSLEPYFALSDVVLNRPVSHRRTNTGLTHMGLLLICSNPWACAPWLTWVILPSLVYLKAAPM